MIIEESASNYIPNDEVKIGEPIIDNGYTNEGNEIKKENWFVTMIKSQTGEGSISSYDNHPLNIKNNDNIAQIIRGLTGMLGSLNFAILDIILGSLGFVKEKKDNENNYSIPDQKESINKNYDRNEEMRKGPTIVNGQNV
jgi:hypothetical protein